MVVKFITLPESNCSPDKQSWSDVCNILRKKIEVNFENEVDYRCIEFMSEDWFKEFELYEIPDNVTFPIILIDNKLFSNGNKVNIQKLIKHITKQLEATL